MKLWDCIIIGDGPAGLSAGIYMSRAKHSNLILGSGAGRWHYGQLNQNYLGFPKGVKVSQLRSRGLEQAKNFGSEFKSTKVTNISQDGNYYVVQGSNNEQYQAKTIIYATGVQDIWPKNLDVERCVGKYVFWCITCDGYRARDKKLLVVANDTTDVESILQFLDFTDNISVICNFDDAFLDEDSINQLKDRGIVVLHHSYTDFRLSKKLFEICINKKWEQFDMCFSLLGSEPKTELIQDTKLCELNSKGYVIIDDKNHTSNLSFAAAGDVTNKHAHQVVTAVHEGAQAAQAITYYLYKHN